MSERGIAIHLHRLLQSDQSATSVTYLDRRGRAAAPLDAISLLQKTRARARVIEANVPAGSTVLLVMPFGSEFLLTLLGCLYAGVVAVPVPDPGSSVSFQRLDGIVLETKPAAVLCTLSNRPLLTEHFAKRAFTSALLAMDVLATDAGSLDNPNREPVCAGLSQSPEKTVIVQYTSGSTRHPRGVALSGSNILSNAALVRERWRLTPDKDLLINWLPHYHDMGLMGGLLYPLLMGGPSVQMSPLAFVQHPMSWLRTIAKFRGTVSGGPAFAFGLCLDTVTPEDLEQLDLSCWQTAFCGAEPVPASLMERFRRRFSTVGLDPRAVYATYGLAEATLLVAGEREWAGEDESVGNDGALLEASRLTPETRSSLLIVNPETCLPLDDGVAGEVWVKGPSVASGYLARTDESEAEESPLFGHIHDSPEKFLRTGDLGWIGPAGLHISGRLKDVLIVNGVNVSAVDVEWLAGEVHPCLNPLAAAAVLLAPNGLEEAALVIEVKTDTAIPVDRHDLEEQIRRTVRGACGIDLSLILIVKRGSLERTTSGKVRRQPIAARLREGWRYPEAL